MFKKVVWATDGSEPADEALEFARGLAAESGGELLAVHCKELTATGRGGGGRYPAHANEDQLQKKIERQVSDLSRDGAQASLQSATTAVGGAAHAISDIARNAGADVIVVGTRGRTALTGLLLGSVTQRLLHIAHCPVLAVPRREDVDENSGSVRTKKS
ncbi:MAG TPA: universal stress protein [Solirubrobacteraceae bacterium]|nr:universal stress protein [Solirubrobacteraceae bacterium]